MNAITRPASGQASSARGTMAALLGTWLLVTMLLWALAFYEVPATAPVWLKRAQLACFGTDLSGLPSAAGWMVLVLSPLGMLGGICVSFWDEVLAFAAASVRLPRYRKGLTFLALVLLLEAVWVGTRLWEKREYILPNRPLESVEALPTEYPMRQEIAPDFTLVDQRGRIVSLSAFRGQPVILSFLFAHCQSVCPALVETVRRAADAPYSVAPVVVFITLDPWRDTPSSLAGMAKRWEMPDTFTLLSGEPEAVNKVIDQYGMARSRDEKSGDVSHPALVHVLSADGKILYTLNNPPARWIEDAVRRAAS